MYFKGGEMKMNPYLDAEAYARYHYGISSESATDIMPPCWYIPLLIQDGEITYYNYWVRLGETR